jgi:hypothetical protein
LNLADVQALPAKELASALDDLGMGPGWIIGDAIRMAATLDPTKPCLSPAEGGRSQAFQNLVVGTIAERVFRERYLAPLEAKGFTVVDYHEKGENRDYALQRDGGELPINVKVASTKFREAKAVVGLDPDDCIPISAYKAIGASERVPELVYVDLVDFTLREKVDAFIDALQGPLAIGWHLLSWYRGKGAIQAQDRFLNTLFNRHAPELLALAPGASAYRVISAQKVLTIMRRNPHRVPGLGVKGAGTGVIVGEVNVHMSVRDETRAWDDVAKELLSTGIGPVLKQIRRTVAIEVPDPAL